MRRTMLAILVAVAVLGAAFPASARTVTLKKYYEASMWAGASGRSDPTCADGCLLSEDGRIEVTRVKFDPLGGTKKTNTVTIKVVDEVDPYGSLSVQVCEDSDKSLGCGAGDRVWRKTCIPNGGKVVVYNVGKANAVLVNLQGVYNCSQYVNDPGSGQGMTTRGVVYLSYVK